MKRNNFKISFRSLLIIFSLLAAGVLFGANNSLADEAASSTPISAGNSGQNTVASSSQTVINEAYKAVVKIKTYALDEDYNLINYADGSGVIIDPSGIVLTNYHVVAIKSDYDDSDIETGHLICLPLNSTDEPACKYTAKLIAKDKDLDLALLKIQPIIDLSQASNYPFLELNKSDTASVNDEVQAIGYPAIGGDSVTITKGIISGKTEKYGKQWIKTDAVISFGNSGGAAIDKNGKIVGLTSASHSDLAGSLGYIINISSIDAWLGSNIAKTPVSSLLENRVIKMAKINSTLNNNNIFTNFNPPYSMVKPADWTFDYSREDALSIENKSDENSGKLVVTYNKTPYFYNEGNVIPAINRMLNKSLASGLTTVTKNTSLTVGGVKGRNVFTSAVGQTSKFIFLPYRQFLIVLLYDYGKNDQDKKIIDKMIQSFSINKKIALPFHELNQVVIGDPQFSLKSPGDWVIAMNNTKANPIEAMNKKIKEAYVNLLAEKINDETKSLNNDGYAKYLKQKLSEINQMAADKLDFMIDSIKINAHSKLNDKYQDVVMIEYVEKKNSSKTVLAYDKEYYIKSGNNYIVINQTVYSQDAKVWKKANDEFSKLLKNFSLSVSKKNIDSDGDGLTDAQEVKYNTNPRDPDTDGDGYSDGLEVSSGYNPRGDGRL